LCLGLACTTLATLILELSLTRIFSVVFYYHFAFLSISIALFGMGAGGIFSYVIASRGRNLYSKLGVMSLANALCILASLTFILSRPFDVGADLALVYLAAALPFFLAGTVVSVAISEAIEQVDRAYFFDLAGASAGCLLLIPLLNWVGGPNTVIVAAVLYCVGAALWFDQAGSMRGRTAAVGGALLLAILVVVNGKIHIVDVRASKGGMLPPERFTAWNSFSRIAVLQRTPSIIIDGDARTDLSRIDWDKELDPAERSTIMHIGPGVPYLVRPGAKALIIGAGGGPDVARALMGGSRDITAVEINPIIANTIMRDKFVALSHGIYLRPEVRVVVEDGRSFIRRSAEKYQVLQATLVDTWASTAAGAFALSENNLYTTDAFYDYLTHLTDDGMVAITRWGFEPPRESLRVVSLAMEALRRLGEADPGRHVAVLRGDIEDLEGKGAQDTVLIWRKALTREDAAALRSIAAEGRLETLYLPGDAAVNPFGDLATSSDPQAFFRDYRYDVSPVSDDRPFFFYTVQPKDLWRFLHDTNRKKNMDKKINRAVPVMFALVGISLAATALVLLLPRWLLGSRLPKQKGVMKFLWYFVCLGAGYILIEVTLIQKFVLLLGHPTYALTVIVFSMLVASGLGSYFSTKFIQGKDATLAGVLLGVTLLVVGLAIFARPLVEAAVSWPMVAKIAVTVLSIAPAAFLMGIPFPSGLRRLEKQHAPSVRWAWSLNAAASVLGSAGAIFLAIYLGLRATLLIGGALYLCALFIILATPRVAERQVS
jgi:hypothetical protein